MKQCLIAMVVLVLCVSGLAQTRKAIRSDGTECAALPCVAASVALTDQTATVPPTQLIAPADGGLFRITYYIESSRMRGSTWFLQFFWRDDIKTRAFLNGGAGPGSYGSLSLVTRVAPGHAITYSVTDNSNPPGTSYNLFVSVEQLQ